MEDPGQAGGQPMYNVYSIGNYTFGTKEAKFEKDKSVEQRFVRMRTKHEQEGMRRSVEGLLLVEDHHHPHVLLMQIGNSFFKLPGGRLRPGEDELEGMKRKLNNNLGPLSEEHKIDWQVGQCIGVYYRPNFDTIMYPYCPPHITRPKEVKKVFVIPLPESCFFAIPKNLKLLAVPLFEIYDNVTRYGAIISAMPQMLSRLRINFVNISKPSLAIEQGQQEQQQQQQNQQVQQLMIQDPLQMGAM
eukprot:TRINITY_DN4919_c1_g1_i1.p1 TRINITY_DN4919_c1_g1~~TRINITY_DN4919_c1_g1_i1.p1  ORF type:complete len:274 (-),score=26.30 TRINITY_DN4919_c1_g1_i1:285-1016(-)